MALQQFSGIGDPNGIVFGNPGDIYQDETGAFWLKVSGVNTATVWALLSGSSVSPFSPPEQWGQDNVAANQVNVALAPKVSTNFNTIEMLRSGSLVGINARLVNAIQAGTLTIEVTINGAPAALNIVMTAPSQSSQHTQNIGLDTYVVGDLIGIRISTDAGFLPAGNNLEVWIELAEVI